MLTSFTLLTPFLSLSQMVIDSVDTILAILLSKGYSVVLRRMYESDETTVDLARVMFDTAILRSGYTLPDSSSFAGRIERMLRLSVGVDSDAPVSSSHCH